jgi:hypothetical protein
MKRFLILFTLWGTMSAQAGLTDGLLGAYLFDGDAQDSSAGQHHGQVIGGTFSEDRFGRPGGALHLDGQGAWVSTPLDGQQHPMSLSFWFYLEARPGERHFAVLSSSMADAFGHGFVIGSGSNQLNANLAADFRFAGRTWTHGVVTYGDTIRVYLNGELSAEKPTPPEAGVPAGRFAIGRHSGSTGGCYFPGKIDEVLIYNREIAAEEVRQLFTLGPEVATQVQAAAVERAQLARLQAAALDGSGTRATRPAGLISNDGPLPLAITVSSAVEPGTNVWAVMDGDTNTAWTADADATGWWMAAEYEGSVVISNIALDAEGETAHGVRWLSSENGADFAPWTPGDAVSLQWLVGLIPATTATNEAPIVYEWRAR